MTELLTSTGARAALWIGAGDSLVSCRIAGAISQMHLDERACELIDTLAHRHGLSNAPSFPEIDLDESTVFDETASGPFETLVRPAMAGGRCVGGFALIDTSPGMDESMVDGAALALAVALESRIMTRRLADASDRLEEISEVGRIFADMGEQERTMSRILELAIRSSSAETGAILQRGRTGDLVATGMPLKTLAAIRFRSGESILDRALDTKEEILLDAEDLGRELEIGASPLVIETLGVFLLIHEEKRYGALILINIASALMGETAFRAMLSTIARLAAAALTTEERQAERLEQELVKSELAAARQIQQSLLPQVMPRLGGIEVAGLWKPSRTVGGDYFDVFPLGDDRLGVMIADVSGKGIPAGLLMAVSRSYLRMIADDCRDSPSAAFARINARLCGEMASNRFITANYLILDLATRTGKMANAGHHEPLLIDAEGRGDVLACSAGGGGLPLGIMEDGQYEDEVFPLEKGTTLLLYTDGLIETRNERGGLLGLGGLIRFLGEIGDRHPVDQLDALWEKTIRFSGDGVPEDDWTAVAVKL